MNDPNTAAHLEWSPVTLPDSAPHAPADSKRRSLDRWLNASVVVGAIVVYLSIYLQSLMTFVAGEILCAGAAVIVGWRHRNDIRHWWHQRLLCPECGQRISLASTSCPHCGHKRIP